MEEVSKMNRLILLGNGFDLAHGLKTRYNDFLVWYFKTILSSTVENEKEYSDELIKVELQSKSYLSALAGIEMNTVPKFVDYFYSTDLSKISAQVFKVAGYNQNFTNPFTIIYKSSFIQQLVNVCSPLNWVDIENHYFETLKLYIANATPDLETNIKGLNKSWSCLIAHLENYLKQQPKCKMVGGYARILYDPLNPDEFVDKLNYTNAKLGDTLVLNFNYTSTIDMYIQGGQNTTIDVNHIHGKLYDSENRLIFGFGDELDEDYLKFEHHKSVGQFDYIKSFWYFKTSNYHDLIRFIESNDYQVYILGHSCGLSDRTMLNMVFESDNCKSIKVFYHGSKENNDYTARTQEISRHFKDKPKMRRRIVSLDKSLRMPQFNDRQW